jgi:hypothetical protein
MSEGARVLFLFKVSDMRVVLNAGIFFKTNLYTCFMRCIMKLRWFDYQYVSEKSDDAKNSF